MFDNIKRLFKKEEEKEETAMKMEDYEKHLEENEPNYEPAYLTIRFDKDSKSDEIPLYVYLRDRYIGGVICNRDKVMKLDPDEEKRVLGQIFKMVEDREEELEQIKLRKDILKEKLEFMRLRNELLKKKIGEIKDGEE